MRRKYPEGKMKKVLKKSASINGMKKAEADQGISEAWESICENPDPAVREFGLSMMENGNPPHAEKIVLYLTMLTQLCNSAPLINEPDAQKRLHLALERIKKLRQEGKF